MNKEDTAVFIGHSECNISDHEVKGVIRQVIALGVTEFLSGGHGGFDRLAASCVDDLKREYPYIKNTIVIPYLNSTVFGRKLFDSVIVPDGFEELHYKARIPHRNKYMVDNAAFAICYITHGWGGAAKTFERAKKQGLIIINLGEKNNR